MKELFRNAFTGTIYKIVSAAIKVLLIILITNLFGAEQYGAYTFSISVFLLVNSLFRFGFDVHLHKKIAETYNFKNKIKCQLIYLKIASISILALLVLSVVFKITLTLFSSSILLSSLKVTYLDEVILYSAFYAALWLFAYYFRGLDKGKSSILIMEVIFPLIQIILVYFLRDLIDKPSVILVNSFGGAVVLSLIIFMYADKLKIGLLWKKRFFIFNNTMKYEFKQGIPFLLISVSSMLMAWVDFYIISFFETDVQLGIYSVATRISLFLLLPVSAVAIFFSNKLVAFFAKKDRSEIIRYLIRISMGLFGVSLLLFLMINIFNTTILSLFGSEFTVATTVLLILTFAHMLNAGTGVFETVILMSKHKKYLFKLNLIIVLLNLIFNIPLVYYYGINGAAIGTFTSIIINRFLQLHLIKKKVLVSF